MKSAKLLLSMRLLGNIPLFILHFQVLALLDKNLSNGVNILHFPMAGFKNLT